MKHIHCPGCGFPIYESGFVNALEEVITLKGISRLLLDENEERNEVLDKILKTPLSGEVRLSPEEIEALETGRDE